MLLPEQLQGVADDPETVRRCYDETFALMQSGLDDLVEDLPHPVVTRVSTALGLDRLGRLFGGG